MDDKTALCPCGSGLTTAHCCAYDAATAGVADPAGDTERTTGDVPEDLADQVARAVAARQAGDPALAEALCLDVLERAPVQPAALRLLAEIREADGKPQAVAALLKRLVVLTPNDFWPVNKLTLLQIANGHIQDAEQNARHAIRIAPTNPQAHNLLAMAMTEAGRGVLGEYHCRRTLELSSTRIPLVLANLATNLTNQGRIEEARALYAESDALAPENRQTLMAWARMEEADRKLDAADALLDRAAAVAPRLPGVTLTRAAIRRRQKRYDEALALLDGIGAAQGREIRPVERLERGRLLDQMGRYDEAWADFAAGKAKALELAGHRYEADVANTMAARLKNMFTRDTLALLPRAGVRRDVAQPIFILGFPRSGTTLLEQTLSAAPTIAAGDELPLVHMLVDLMPRLFPSPLAYPEALSELWMGDRREGLDDLRDFYLQKARHLGVMREGATLFTDKMPLNETHLGLIALVFPAAPLLHVVRHPLDIMVSAMSNFFTHGFHCGTALATAARHLVLSADLVAHYRAEMDLNLKAVRYEDMVDDQAATIRGVFDFIGVPFDAAVLRQEENARYARTASYAQVTEKLYDSSRYRYRHYLRHLEPAIPILAPLIERLGYTIEG